MLVFFSSSPCREEKLLPSRVPEGSGIGARVINTLSRPWQLITHNFRVSCGASALGLTRVACPHYPGSLSATEVGHDPEEHSCQELLSSLWEGLVGQSKAPWGADTLLSPTHIKELAVSTAHH